MLGPMYLLFVYLIGTIPVGFLIARAKGIDITNVGSGSVGATNVARSVGKRAGIVTLIGDACKGTLGVIIGGWLFPTVWGPPIAAMLVVAGHCFSLPPVLKGGKGVATALGAITTLFPLAALFGIVTFAICFALSRIVSLSSLSAAVVIPLVALATGKEDPLCLSLVVISFLVLYRHHQNIDRLIKGTEPKFTFKRAQ